MTDEEWAVSVERGELVKAYYKAEKIAATADASNAEARGEAYRANIMAADAKLGQLIQLEGDLIGAFDELDIATDLVVPGILRTDYYQSY